MWKAPPITLDNVHVSPRGADKNVSLELDGAGLNGDISIYTVFLVAPGAYAVSLLEDFIKQSKRGLSGIVQGEDLKAPGVNTLTCTLVNPKPGEYILALLQLANGQLFAELFPEHLKIPE